MALLLEGCQTASQNYGNVTHFSTVVIDPGHGGYDSGTASRGGEVRTLGRRHGRHRRVVIVKTIPGVRLLEKNLALDVATRVAAKLRDHGLRVVMTRHEDVFIPLDDRAKISNAQRDSVFVSIHFNDSWRRAIHGMEVYQNGRGTNQLAHRIEAAIAGCPGGVNRGVMSANYRVLRKSKGPAVLVECSYLSNEAEAKRCASAEYREELASAIARAIVEQRQ